MAQWVCDCLVATQADSVDQPSVSSFVYSAEGPCVEGYLTVMIHVGFSSGYKSGYNSFSAPAIQVSDRPENT